MAKSAIAILAAGEGRRMKSTLPKVLHPVGGAPMIFHILETVKKASPSASVAVLVGKGRESVEKAIREEDAFKKMDLHFVVQPEQKGTGDAARCLVESDWGKSHVKSGNPMLILPGDSPLLPVELVKEISKPLEKNSALRLLTTTLPNPFGYGRVLRERSGQVSGIVEEKDATIEQRSINEVAVSMYLFHSAYLAENIGKLSSQNAQGEFYLTDLVGLAHQTEKDIETLSWNRFEDLKGVNNLWELAEASKTFHRQNLKRWCEFGVFVKDPSATWVDLHVELSEGVRLAPGVHLKGKTRIGKRTEVGPGVILKDVQVGEDVILKAGTVAEESIIGNTVTLGPYAHLRPQSKVGVGSKIGNFVELKKTTIGEKTSVAHLSYLGDATVGDRVNIGCGFITCNFDGRMINGSRKHPTVIEDDVFMGSDCQVIAPIRIGKGSYIASGSTLNQDVESDALAIARAKQVNKNGMAKRFRPKEKK